MRKVMAVAAIAMALAVPVRVSHAGGELSLKASDACADGWCSPIPASFCGGQNGKKGVGA